MYHDSDDEDTRKDIELYRVYTSKTYGDIVHLSSNTYDYSSDDIVKQILIKCKKVEFGPKYNSLPNWLYEGITQIQFSDNFNQSIEHIPQSVKTLSIGHWNRFNPIFTYFNQSLDYLNYGIENLEIVSRFFDKTVDNLPPNLKQIKLISNRYIPTTLNNFPDSIEKISISSFDFENTVKIPTNLKTIVLANINYISAKPIQRDLEQKFPNISVRLGMLGNIC